MNEKLTGEMAMAVIATRSLNIAETLKGNGGNEMYISFTAETDNELIDLFNALNGDVDNNISDMINMEIEIADVIVEQIELPNERTGEIEPVPRVIIINSKGEKFQAFSFGVYNSLDRMFQMFGQPNTWKAPKLAVVKQVKVKNGSMTKLDLVPPKKK